MPIRGELHITHPVNTRCKASLSGIVVGDIDRCTVNDDGQAEFHIRWDWETFDGTSSIFVYDKDGRVCSERSSERRVIPGSDSENTLRYWFQEYGLDIKDISLDVDEVREVLKQEGYITDEDDDPPTPPPNPFAE
jgi:hypothetical protein